MKSDNFSKVTHAHQAKLAYVYIRQSSLSQVIKHTESTNIQYELAERAAQLGWPKDRIHLIDTDLGKSGSSTDSREGFQHLTSEIGLGRVGLVLSVDVSRLSRNNADWYQLLELCSLFGTLIGDGENLYDPRLYTDRLLLGLSGMMSEAELHQIKQRMHNGAKHKAERGELHQSLPVGLVRLRSDEVVLNPDAEVESRIRLVFEKFQELRTANAVTRYLQGENLSLPSRPLFGPAPHDIVWQEARSSTVLGILHNPAYAGTYVYGQTFRDPTRRKPGHTYSGIVRRARMDWPIVIQGVYPAYISWDEFLVNQDQLDNNQNRYHENRLGVPRKGAALLQGITRCGRCGARMTVRYSGGHNEVPVYTCRYERQQFQHGFCQEVRAVGLDEEVEQLVLAALTPDQIALAFAAMDQIEKEQATLCQQWQIRLERARYEAERAHRQFHEVEPENRLVARNLEILWEQKLRAVEKLEIEYQEWLKRHRLEITETDRQEILALGENLPKVWSAATTTAIDKKQIVRFLIQEVVVDQSREKGKVWFRIIWQTGATSEHSFIRRVLGYADYIFTEQIEQRIRELHSEGKIDGEIADTLNAEGWMTPHRQHFTSKLIWILRNRMGLPTVIHQGVNPKVWEDGTFSIQGAAERLGVFPGTIYTWIKTGLLDAQQVTKGTPWQIRLDEERITFLQDRLQRVRRSKKRVL